MTGKLFTRHAVIGLSLLFLAACSGNMTGGATPPVQQSSIGNGLGSNGGVNTLSNGVAVPVTATPSASPVTIGYATMKLTNMSTPLPLPSVLGFGGNLSAKAAGPVPSETPTLDLILALLPQEAHLQDGPSEQKDMPAALSLDITPNRADAVLAGWSAIRFTLPPTATKITRFAAMRLYETQFASSSHTFFGHRKIPKRTLLARDNALVIDGMGVIRSSQTTPLTLFQHHHYKVLLYSDKTVSLTSLFTGSATISPVPTGTATMNSAAATSSAKAALPASSPMIAPPVTSSTSTPSAGPSKTSTP